MEIHSGHRFPDDPDYRHCNFKGDEMKLAEAHLRLDAVQIQQFYTIAKNNPIFARINLGMEATAHMTPEWFISKNNIEIIDDEPPMVHVVDYDKLIHGELVVVG